jgi:CIC family chloride channel protein
VSASLVGLACGLGAVCFQLAGQVVISFALAGVVGYRGEPVPDWLPGADATFRPWLFLIVPTVGGLVSGLLVWLVAPEAAGGGTDVVITTYHKFHGEIRTRVPLVKLLASALLVGSGSSGGREGPMAQVGAGIGSLIGRFLNLRPAERRLLLAVGMGAGIAGIFRAPLGGALFAAEVLYHTPRFNPAIVILGMVASFISYGIFGSVFGWELPFPAQNLTINSPGELACCVPLALFLVLLAKAYTRTFHACTRLFQNSFIPAGLRPAVGAFLSGALALGLYVALDREERVFRVLSFGLGALRDEIILDADVPAGTAGLFLVVALGKLLTACLTNGSGGSGGLFGPSLIIGGCGGGALAVFLNALQPGSVPHPAAFTVMGMAGCFAAAARTPLSTLVLVTELTGSYQLLAPGFCVCMVTYWLSDKQSLFHGQAPVSGRMALNPFFTAAAQIPALTEGDTLTRMVEQLQGTNMQVLPVVDRDERLLGMVRLEDVQWAREHPHLRPLLLAADLLYADVPSLQQDDWLVHALELFAKYDCPALPVVDSFANRRFVGLVEQVEIEQ